MRKPVRLGIAGPVGSGKTTLLIELCRELGRHYSIAAITNDIFTQEDAEIVARSGAIRRVNWTRRSVHTRASLVLRV